MSERTSRFWVGDQPIGEDLESAQAQHLLTQAYRQHLRPLCDCRDDGVPMYVAHGGSHLIVKRMPGTGMNHAAGCPSWAPAEALSGLGQVLGNAISPDLSSGMTTIRLDFPLSQRSSPAAAPADGAADAAPSTVAADPTKLTLLSTLHYLWDEAGFTHWSPAMAGKRRWSIISWHLSRAAASLRTGRVQIGARIYIPEPYSVDRKDAIAARRRAVWQQAAPARGAATKMLLLIGEVKDLSPARFGHKLLIKHVPDAPLYLSDDLLRKMQRRYREEWDMWQANDTHHLLAICTFSLSRSHIPTVDRIALMLVDDHWLPVRSVENGELINRAVGEHRRFTVGLRYNLAAPTPIADLTLTDTDPVTAVYSASGDDQIMAAFEEELHASGADLHRWDYLNPTALPPRSGVRHEQGVGP